MFKVVDSDFSAAGIKETNFTSPPGNYEVYVEITKNGEILEFLHDDANGYGSANGNAMPLFSSWQVSDLPDKPINLTAELYKEDTTVMLKWDDHSLNEQGFIIERKIGKGDFKVLDTLNSIITQYIDDSLSLETNYYYRVNAYNSIGNSDYSNEVQINPDSLLHTVVYNYSNTESVVVFPNPFTDKLMLNMGVLSLINYDIIDILGRKLFSENNKAILSQENHQFEISLNQIYDLKPGIYFLRLNYQNLNGNTAYKTIKIQKI